MTEPSDTDRIIAAHRVEASKTRVLLVWLLVGVPLIGLVLWGCIVGIIALAHSGHGATDTVIQPTAPLATISNTTSCASVNDGATDDALNTYTGGYFNGGVRQGFMNECNDNPAWTAAQALAQAHRDLVAPSN